MSVPIADLFLGRSASGGFDPFHAKTVGAAALGGDPIAIVKLAAAGYAFGTLFDPTVTPSTVEVPAVFSEEREADKERLKRLGTAMFGRSYAPDGTSINVTPTRAGRQGSLAPGYKDNYAAPTDTSAAFKNRAARIRATQSLADLARARAKAGELGGRLDQAGLDRLLSLNGTAQTPNFVACAMWLEAAPHIGPYTEDRERFGEADTSSISSPDRRHAADAPIGIQFPATVRNNNITEGYSVQVDAEPAPGAQPRVLHYRGGRWRPIEVVIDIRIGDGFTGEFLRGGDDDYLFEQESFNAKFLKAHAAEERNRVKLRLALRDVQKRVRFLQALAFPRPATDPGRPASSVVPPNNQPSQLVWALGDWALLRGYIEEISVRWLSANYVSRDRHGLNGHPYGAEVTISFMPNWAFQPSFYSVVKNVQTGPSAERARFADSPLALSPVSPPQQRGIGSLVPGAGDAAQTAPGAIDELENEFAKGRANALGAAGRAAAEGGPEASLPLARLVPGAAVSVPLEDVSASPQVSKTAKALSGIPFQSFIGGIV